MVSIPVKAKYLPNKKMKAIFKKLKQTTFKFQQKAKKDKPKEEMQKPSPVMQRVNETTMFGQVFTEFNQELFTPDFSLPV